MRKLYNLTIILAISVLLTGCKDFFDPETNDTLQDKDYIGAYTELYMGFIGITSSFSEALENVIYVEGLRSNFMEPTNSAGPDSWAVYNYADHTGSPFTSSNILASPANYYKVILNANDYMQHASEYYKANPTGVSDEEFRALIGGAIRYKVWAYMMLAKIYGEAVYIDDPLIKITDISQFPLWGQEEIFSKCIDLINTGVEIDGKYIDGKGNINWAVFVDPVAASPDQSWNRICPHPGVLLGELYLWKNDYQSALNSLFDAITWINTIEDDYKWILNSPTRAQGQQTRNLYVEQLWTNTSWATYEAVFGITYDINLQQTNTLRYNLSESQNFTYRATEVAAERYINSGDGEIQSRRASTIRDYETREILKYNQNGKATYEPYPHIYGMRAAEIYLMITEACAGLNNWQAAMAIFDGSGMDQTSPFYAMVSDGAFTGYLTGFPIALYGSRNTARQHMGIRSRANAPLYGNGAIVDNPNQDPEFLHKKLDSMVVEEWIYETSGEGRAYFQIPRMAKRWGADFIKPWAEEIASKYAETGSSGTILGILSNPNNWFIKYDLGGLAEEIEEEIEEY